MAWHGRSQVDASPLEISSRRLYNIQYRVFSLKVEVPPQFGVNAETEEDEDEKQFCWTCGLPLVIMPDMHEDLISTIKFKTYEEQQQQHLTHRQKLKLEWDMRKRKQIVMRCTADPSGRRNAFKEITQTLSALPIRFKDNTYSAIGNNRPEIYNVDYSESQQLCREIKTSTHDLVGIRTGSDVEGDEASNMIFTISREKDAEPSEPCSTPTGFSRLLSSLFSSCHMEMRSLLPAITTHNMKHVSRGLAVEVFHPKTNYTTSGKGVDLPKSLVQSSIEEQVVPFLSSQLQVDSANLVLHVLVLTAPHEQDGVPFVNAVANVALKQDRVVAFGQSFVDTTNIADSKPSVEVASVIPRVEQALDGKHNSVQPTVEYLTLQDSSIVLFHVIQVQNEAAMTWHEAYVDAHSGELVSITDFVAQASYKVLPMWKELPTEGYEILVDHQNSVASPFGWHNDGITNTTVTAGNNVITYIGAERPRQPLGQAALSSSTTHAFYVINSFHDVLYLYGFTESTFNFQTNNFDKGGLGNDRVLVSLDDSAGQNNADFATPPDGAVWENADLSDENI
uniref:Extracellular metalloproteinase n=1 Tax=Moniliophthora roreri TaxID=221103 RepID=A0A0W0EZT8_MONRR